VGTEIYIYFASVNEQASNLKLEMEWSSEAAFYRAFYFNLSWGDDLLPNNVNIIRTLE